jgi:hypothetical protein
MRQKKTKNKKILPRVLKKCTCKVVIELKPDNVLWYVAHHQLIRISVVFLLAASCHTASTSILRWDFYQVYTDLVPWTSLIVSLLSFAGIVCYSLQQGDVGTSVKNWRSTSSLGMPLLPCHPFPVFLTLAGHPTSLSTLSSTNDHHQDRSETIFACSFA